MEEKKRCFQDGYRLVLRSNRDEEYYTEIRDTIDGVLDYIRERFDDYLHSICKVNIGNSIPVQKISWVKSSGMYLEDQGVVGEVKVLEKGESIFSPREIELAAQ